MLLAKITDIPIEIINPWCDSLAGSTFPAIRIRANSVYSITDCVVINIQITGNLKNTAYIVTVQYDADTFFRYSGLCELSPTTVSGHVVRAGQCLGKVDSLLTFEVCTDEESRWPVRLTGRTVYKHDPTEYILHD